MLAYFFPKLVDTHEHNDIDIHKILILIDLKLNVKPVSGSDLLARPSVSTPLTELSENFQCDVIYVFYFNYSSQPYWCLTNDSIFTYRPGAKEPKFCF